MLLDILLILLIIALALYIWCLHYIIDTWKSVCMGWQSHYSCSCKAYDELKEKYEKLKMERQDLL